MPSPLRDVPHDALPASRSFRELVQSDRPPTPGASPQRPRSKDFSLDSDSSSGAKSPSLRPRSKDFMSSPLIGKTRSMLSLKSKKEPASPIEPPPMPAWNVDSDNPLFVNSSSNLASSQLPAERKPRGSKILVPLDSEDEIPEPVPHDHILTSLAKPRSSKIAIPPDTQGDGAVTSPILTPASVSATAASSAAAAAAAAAAAHPQDVDIAHVRTRPRDISLEMPAPSLPTHPSQHMRTAPKIKEDDDFYISSGDEDDSVSFYAFFKEASHVPLKALLSEIEAKGQAKQGPGAPASPIISSSSRKKGGFHGPRRSKIEEPSSPESPSTLGIQSPVVGANGNQKKQPKSLKNVLSFRR